MERNKRNLDWKLQTMRISLGILMLWFGLLKLFDSDGEAETLAARTLAYITFEVLEGKPAIYFVAALECVIGVGILVRRWFRYVLPVLFVHLAGTAAPLLLFPEKTWQGFLMPTFVGQYIIKNCILLSAALVLSVIPYGGTLIKKK